MSDKQMKSGFMFSYSTCSYCTFKISKESCKSARVHLVLHTPQRLKEDIVNYVRKVHNKNCESKMIIVIDNCYYE